jgi:hypothetical protein
VSERGNPPLRIGCFVFYTVSASLYGSWSPAPPADLSTTHPPPSPGFIALLRSMSRTDSATQSLGLCPDFEGVLLLHGGSYGTFSTLLQAHYSMTVSCSLIVSHCGDTYVWACESHCLLDLYEEETVDKTLSTTSYIFRASPTELSHHRSSDGSGSRPAIFSSSFMGVAPVGHALHSFSEFHSIVTNEVV